MQEHHRNGQGDKEIAETSDPLTITRAALNRQIISSGTMTGPNKCQRINREVSASLVVQKVVRNLLKSFRWD